MNLSYGITPGSELVRLNRYACYNPRRPIRNLSKRLGRHQAAPADIARVKLTVGGWHLFELDAPRLAWTAGKLRELEVQNFPGAHYTRLKALYRIREHNCMAREKCLVGSVGATFDLK